MLFNIEDIFIFHENVIIILYRLISAGLKVFKLIYYDLFNCRNLFIPLFQVLLIAKQFIKHRKSFYALEG